MTGVRTVITKAKASMAIVTLEDLQGTIEVVVFPRLYEQTTGTWRDGEILLVAGRVDHKSEEVSLLADLAVEWDAAATAGEDVFARQVAAGDRGARRPGARHSSRMATRRRERWQALQTVPAWGVSGACAAARRRGSERSAVGQRASRSFGLGGQQARSSIGPVAPAVGAVPFVSPRRAGARSAPVPCRHCPDRTGRARVDIPRDPGRGA